MMDIAFRLRVLRGYPDNPLATLSRWKTIRSRYPAKLLTAAFGIWESRVTQAVMVDVAATQYRHVRSVIGAESLDVMHIQQIKDGEQTLIGVEGVQSRSAA